jgi:uncharacterized DUF497 family protein
MPNFEWDSEKAKANLKKHKVIFAEAITVFDDPLSITIHDPHHSIEEEHYIDIGYSIRGRILVVVYIERESGIRIISCRRATKSERETYEREDT